MRELPEIVLVCVNRLSRGKFPGLNIHGYVKNKTKKAPMTFNVVISREFFDGKTANHKAAADE